MLKNTGKNGKNLSNLRHQHQKLQK